MHLVWTLLKKDDQEEDGDEVLGLRARRGGRKARTRNMKRGQSRQSKRAWNLRIAAAQARAQAALSRSLLVKLISMTRIFVEEIDEITPALTQCGVESQKILERNFLNVGSEVHGRQKKHETSAIAQHERRGAGYIGQ